MIIGLPQQLSKLSNPSLSFPSATPVLPCASARNLWFILDSFLSFLKQISQLSSTYHYHILDLHRIRHTLDFNIAFTIATSLIHSHLDCCNSLYNSLWYSQLHRLHSIQNALVRAVSIPLHTPITATLQSLHWFKIEQRIQYKVISITYDILHNSESTYLHCLLTPRLVALLALLIVSSLSSSTYFQAKVLRPLIS